MFAPITKTERTRARVAEALGTIARVQNNERLRNNSEAWLQRARVALFSHDYSVAENCFKMAVQEMRASR